VRIAAECDAPQRVAKYSLCPTTGAIGSHRFEISSISDLLLIGCKSRAVLIPCFVTSFERPFLQTDEFVSEVEILASIEIVDGFLEFVALRAIPFAANRRLGVVKGFDGRSRLERIEIPISFDVIDVTAFSPCAALAEVVLSVPTHRHAFARSSECATLQTDGFPHW
jgi:hypothetical protein